MEDVPDKKFPLYGKDYKLYEEVGEGVSATVYRALCIPLNKIVAIKVLDLEKCNNDLDGIRREVQTMCLINHPNLLQAHCSFTSGHNLWVVMPYMAGGSCLHIMKSAYPEGFEEPVIATLLREVLKALVYLHAQGHIHRDVKAGNILIDSNGAVKLADFGVSACMFDTGDRQRSRNTFVGTPCWMAPEVMQQLHGYDFKADIWSFGITALELAHGHAPFSKYPPMKVLLMTLQNAPPGLDYERDKRFSKAFKDLVAACLVKDPKKRPTSEKLLKHAFFKHARSTDYLSRTILEGLAPLGERFSRLKEKEAALLVQNKALYEDKEQLSQQEYIRGISEWNFNLEDLKRQAAMIQDDDVPHAEDSGARKQEKGDNVGFQVERSSDRTDVSNAASSKEDPGDDLHDLKSSLASFPIKPLQALKDCFDVGEDNVTATEEQLPLQSSPEGGSAPRQLISDHKKFSSGPLPENVAASKKITSDCDRDPLQPKYPSERNYSGPLSYRQRRDVNNFLADDTSEGPVVQRKGRFKVTSADHSPKGPMNCLFGPATGGSSCLINPNLVASSLLPSLQCILQQNAFQREEIIKLIKSVEQFSGKPGEAAEASAIELMQASPASPRERELQSLVLQLQQSVTTLIEELQKQKMKNSKLEKQLKSLASQQEDRVG
ncbi:hypothetical protein CDL15_Pgr005724 [Punica granatum]|uniref:Protein kinase domain-containing protein n=1 Tax=Punica granatum TaxID=22663 RepID=A0A218WFD6_PUNGR|nr:hypothetical protein CDL15_Pgr005724 [Punica granatum]